MAVRIKPEKVLGDLTSGIIFWHKIKSIIGIGVGILLVIIGILFLFSNAPKIVTPLLILFGLIISLSSYWSFKKIGQTYGK